jgi:hypothetical protein
LTMGTATFFTPSTRVRGGVPLGAPTRLSCAAAGFQQQPRGSCEGRDSKIEALQNRS